MRGGFPSPVGGSDDAGPTAMRRMIGFKSAGRSDVGFLRRRATLGLDSLARASASYCMHGAFESEPLHCIRALPQKSTGNLDVVRDLHKESENPPRNRTNISRETSEVGHWDGRSAKSPAPGGRGAGLGEGTSFGSAAFRDRIGHVPQEDGGLPRGAQRPRCAYAPASSWPRT